MLVCPEPTFLFKLIIFNLISKETRLVEHEYLSVIYHQQGVFEEIPKVWEYRRSDPQILEDTGVIQQMIYYSEMHFCTPLSPLSLMIDWERAGYFKV